MRAVRIFVSSTFQDMHAERDALTRIAFPALRRRFAERGVAVSEIDLRWGITREDAAESNVLPICLAEIERCHPFFIALIGERYGWIDPRAGTILGERFGHLRDYAARSVTELEIRHAALNPPPSRQGQGRFYFRTPSGNSGPQPEIARLEADIRRAHPDACRDYASLGDLVRWVEEDVGRLIDATLEREAGAVARAQLWKQVLPICAPGAIRRKGLLDGLKSALSPPEARVAVVGPRGCGKTTLLTTFVAEQSEGAPAATSAVTRLRALALRARGGRGNPRWLVSAACALGQALDWRTPIADICLQLEGENAQAAALPAEALLRHARGLLLRHAASEPIAICIDGLDDLEPEHETELGWLEQLAGCRLPMMVACSGDALRRRLARLGFRTFEVPPFTPAEASGACRSYLAVYGKRLSDQQVQPLASVGAAIPALLRLRLDELRLFGSFECLDAEIRRIAALETLPDIVAAVLSRVAADATLPARGAAGDVVSLVSLSRTGLDDGEIRGMLAGLGREVSQRELSELMLALAPLFVMRSGAWRPASAEMRTAIAAPSAERCLGAMIGHFSKAPCSPRSLDELPSLLVRAGRWDALAAYLSDADVVLAFEACRFHEVRTLAMACERQAPGTLCGTLAASCAAETGAAGTTARFPTLVRLLAQIAPSKALELVARALHARPTGDELVRLRDLAAHIDTALGRHEQALRHLAEVQAVTPRGKAWSALTQRLVASALACGADDVAARNVEQLLDAPGIEDDPHTLQAARSLQAALFMRRGDLEPAEALYAEQRRFGDRHGDLSLLQTAIGNLALIARLRRRPREALALHAEEARLCGLTGDAAAHAACLGNQALAAMDAGDLDGALRLLEAKACLAAERHDAFAELEAYLGQGVLFARLGQPAVALQLLARTRARALECGAPSIARDAEAVLQSLQDTR